MLLLAQWVSYSLMGYAFAYWVALAVRWYHRRTVTRQQARAFLEREFKR